VKENEQKNGQTKETRPKVQINNNKKKLTEQSKQMKPKKLNEGEDKQ